MEIQGNVFVVTGAGSGLGAATAKMLVEAGGAVVGVDINPQAGDKLATDLGTAFRFVAADVTDEESAAAVFATAATLGALRGLVNCAGVAPAERIVGREAPHRLDTFARTISINLVGSFNMLRLAADRMAKNAPDDQGERGVIVNTASVAAYEGQIAQAAYAASKGGIVALTLPAARELSRFGIRVMTIAPGVMETPMLLSMPAEVQKALGETVPFPPRMGRPAEFAGLVRYIFANGYLNGEVIRMDGALRMAAK